MSDEPESSCVGVCQFDEAGYCMGCGRSADEVFGNSDSSESASQVEVVRAPVHPGPSHPEG